MLTIRYEQMQALDQAMQRQFERQMLAHLRAAFSSQTARSSDEYLTALIRQGIRNAAGYGVVNEFDVGRYIEYVLLYGPNFDSDSKTAWAGEILRTEEINGTQKMDRIDARDLFEGRK